MEVDTTEKNQEFVVDSNHDVKVVVPGDYIGNGFVAGHGTITGTENPKEIYASLAGVVHHID